MITTPRLSLRCIEANDLSNIHQLHSLAETDRFNTLGIPKNEAETASIIEPWIKANQQKHPDQNTFAIENQTQQFIGLFGLKVRRGKYRSAEIWYKLHSDFWGQGFASEAVEAVLNFCFQNLDLHRVEAGCAVENVASIRVLEKVGMVREGRKRAILPLKTGWSDNFEYAILESEWRPSTQ